MMYRRGQTALEYVLIFGAIIAVLIVMSSYVRNSLSGKWREAADVFGQGDIYRPQ